MTPTFHNARDRMPRAGWEIGRASLRAFITLHYFGPGAPRPGNDERELAGLASAARNRHMQPSSKGGLGADGLQYHLVVCSSGRIYQTRDLDAILWHCGHPVGNSQSLAVNLPIQDPWDATDAQWAAFCELADYFIGWYGMAGRSAVKPHSYWKSTACPGPRLRGRLLQWHAAQPPVIRPRSYRVIAGIDQANVREGPGLRFPIALGGTAQFRPGTVVEVDAVIDGDPIGRQRFWAHLASGLGFVHLSLLEPV